LRLILADAFERRGDLGAARDAALAVARQHPDSRLAPRALLEAAILAMRAGDDAGAQTLLVRLLDAYPDAPATPEALYLLGQTAEALGRRDDAAQAYRELRVLAPTTGWADGAAEPDAAEALWMQGRALEDAQRPGEAATVYRALATRYPRREVAGGALWRLGWNAYLSGKPAEAAEQWAKLDATGSRAWKLPALYWRARATEDARGRAAAAPLYASVLAEAPR